MESGVGMGATFCCGCDFGLAAGVGDLVLIVSFLVGLVVIRDGVVEWTSVAYPGCVLPAHVLHAPEVCEDVDAHDEQSPQLDGM